MSRLSMDEVVLQSPQNPTSPKIDTGPQCWFWAGWEPARHYRRSGKSGSPFFGKGAWLPEWEKRKFSNELIDAALDLGATVLITEFLKGFGRKLEEENWPKLKDFVDRCHDRGLKVWGYAQARSLYFETLANEVENWENWTAKNQDGTRQVFAQNYYRCAPCLTSASYEAYTASTITEGISHIGFDGVHLDNAYYQHCWCPRCAELFRKSLAERGDFEDLLGIPLSKHIQPPPIPLQGGVGLDPLQILWIRFGVDVRLGFFRRIREHLLATHPQLTIAGNPAFPRSDTSFLSRCVDPSRESEAFDFLCCENGNLPRIDQGWISSQAEAHLLAESGGYGIWATAWRETEDGVAPPRGPGGIWAGLAEEYSFGDMLGNNWAFRPSGEGARFYVEDEPEMAAAFRDATNFFRYLDSEIRPGKRRTWAEVAILHDPLSASLSGSSEIRFNQALQQYLLQKGIPFHIVMPGQAVPEMVRVLVAFYLGAISDQTIEQILEFAQQTGRIAWMGGNTAQNDEWFVPRDRRDVERYRSAPGVYFSPAFGDTWQKASRHPIAAAPSESGGYFAKHSIDAGSDDWSVFEEVFSSALFQATVHCDRPSHILVHSQIAEDGRRLFHFRDQSGSGDLVNGVTLRVSSACPDQSTARVICVGKDQKSHCHNLTMQQGSLHLPAFHHYAAAILEG